MYYPNNIYTFMELLEKYMLFPIDDAFEIISRLPEFGKGMPKNARYNLRKLAKERKHVSDDNMASHLTTLRWEMVEPARKSMWRPIVERDWNVQLIYFNDIEAEYGIVKAETAEDAKEIVIAKECKIDETFEVMGKQRNKSDWMRCQLIATEVK